MLQNQGQIGTVQRMPSQFDALNKSQGQIIGQNLSQGQMQFPQGHGQGMRSPYQQSPANKDNLLKQGDFPLMSGGESAPISPGQGHHIRPPMFSQPPPSAVPFPNFSNPPPDLTSSSNLHQNSQTSQLPGNHGFHGNHTNFAHAPGTERPHVGRPQDQGQMRQPVPPNQPVVSILI